MADEKRNNETEKSFVVRDKRFTAQKEEEKVSPKDEMKEEPIKEKKKSRKWRALFRRSILRI